MSIARRVREAVHLAREFAALIARRFFADQCPQAAAALTFTTLLSLVPLMAVTLLGLARFLPVEDALRAAHHFIFLNFIPATGESVYAQLTQFVEKSARLKLVGAVALAVTALLLMRSIDTTLNHIWHTPQQRGLARAVGAYSLMLVLGPALLGLSVLMTSYLMSAPFMAGSEVGQRSMGIVLRSLPFMTAVTGFVALYLLVPNARVRFLHALSGGLCAALLFDLAKRGFVAYVAWFPSYEFVYGAWAVIPLLLLWIYVVWLIVLFGAELTHCVGVFRGQAQQHAELASAQLSVDAFRVLGHMWRAGQAQRRLSLSGLLLREPDLGAARLTGVLRRLEAGGLAHRGERGEWDLAAGFEALRVWDLLRVLGRVPDPRAEWRQRDAWNEAFAASLTRLAEAARSGPGSRLVDLYTADDAPRPSSSCRASAASLE